MLESGFLNGQDSCSLDGHTWQPISNFIVEEKAVPTSTNLQLQSTNKPTHKKIIKSTLKPAEKNNKSEKTKVSSLDNKMKTKAATREVGEDPAWGTLDLQTTQKTKVVSKTDCVK